MTSYLESIREDVRTDGEIISDIRDLLIQMDTLLTIIHTELDLLRFRNKTFDKEPEYKYEDLGE